METTFHEFLEHLWADHEAGELSDLELAAAVIMEQNRRIKEFARDLTAQFHEWEKRHRECSAEPELSGAEAKILEAMVDAVGEAKGWS